MLISDRSNIFQTLPVAVNIISSHLWWGKLKLHSKPHPRDTTLASKTGMRSQLNQVTSGNSLQRSVEV